MNGSTHLSPEELERHKPEDWPCLLFAAVLEADLMPVLSGYEARRWGSQVNEPKLGFVESRDLLAKQLAQVRALHRRVIALLQRDLPQSLGGQGRPGDATAIREVSRKLGECGYELLLWEGALDRVRLHPMLADSLLRLRGVTETWVDELATIPALIRDASGPGKSGVLTLNLLLDTDRLNSVQLPSRLDCVQAIKPAIPRLLDTLERNDFAARWRRFENGVKTFVLVCLGAAAIMLMCAAHPLLCVGVVLFLWAAEPT